MLLKSSLEWLDWEDFSLDRIKTPQPQGAGVLRWSGVP